MVKDVAGVWQASPNVIVILNIVDLLYITNKVIYVINNMGEVSISFKWLSMRTIKL